MKIGPVSFCTGETLAPNALAVAVEERGLRSLFLTDHAHIPVSRATGCPDVYGDGELPEFCKRTYDLFVGLSFVAAATSKLEVGTGICLGGQRAPIVTAKEVASRDPLLGGRLAAFGVGFGWHRNELEAHGTDFRSRREIARDRIELMRALCRDEAASLEAEHTSLKPSWAWPKPSSEPRVYLGGGGPTTMRHAAEWADVWYPVIREDDPTVEKDFRKFRSVVDEVGRDFKDDRDRSLVSSGRSQGPRGSSGAGR